MAKRYFENNKARPGVISNDLRRALGLHSDKLPLWIYRMRVLGYPPGWLQHAKVNTLAIFDGNGEDGELNDSSELKDQEYNKDSLIEYPGFNCPPPPGVRDDWHYLRMPPMLPTQQLHEALKTMKVSEPVPYKKAKLDLSGSSQSSTPETSKKAPEFKTPSSVSSNNDSFSKPGSSNGNKSDLNLSSSSISSVDDGISMTPSKDSEKPNENGERKLKMISMGSPMPASERPKRPPLEKWAVGMGELLYFENPSTEYTGNYKNKIKGVIDKIRQTQH